MHKYLVAAIVAICAATSSHADNWKASQTTDPMTDETSYNVTSFSQTDGNLGQPNLLVLFSCRPNGLFFGLNIRDTSGIKLGWDGEFESRFDNRDIQKHHGYKADVSTGYIENEKAATFLKEALQSESMVIRVNGVVGVFSTSDLKSNVTNVIANCSA